MSSMPKLVQPVWRLVWGTMLRTPEPTSRKRECLASPVAATMSAMKGYELAVDGEGFVVAEGLDVGPDGAPVCVVDDAAAEAERAFEEAVEMLVVLEGWKQDLLA